MTPEALDFCPIGCWFAAIIGVIGSRLAAQLPVCGNSCLDGCAAV